MNKLVILVIVILVFAFLYFQGYLKLGEPSLTTSFEVPNEFYITQSKDISIGINNTRNDPILDVNMASLNIEGFEIASTVSINKIDPHQEGFITAKLIAKKGDFKGTVSIPISFTYDNKSESMDVLSASPTSVFIPDAKITGTPGIWSPGWNILKGCVAINSNSSQSIEIDVTNNEKQTNLDNVKLRVSTDYSSLSLNGETGGEYIWKENDTEGKKVWVAAFSDSFVENSDRKINFILSPYLNAGTSASFNISTELVIGDEEYTLDQKSVNICVSA